MVTIVKVVCGCSDGVGSMLWSAEYSVWERGIDGVCMTQMDMYARALSGPAVGGRRWAMGVGGQRNGGLEEAAANRRGANRVVV